MDQAGHGAAQVSPEILVVWIFIVRDPVTLGAEVKPNLFVFPTELECDLITGAAVGPVHWHSSFAIVEEVLV